MEVENDKNRLPWTRRLFVRDALLGWIGLVIGPAVYSLFRRYEFSLFASSEMSKELGPVVDFAPSQAREVVLGGRKVLVARLKSGDWSAVSAVCTHLGCSVRVDRDGDEDVFACNCHNSKFSVDGTNLSGPAPMPLKRFDVEIRENRVILSASKVDNDEALE